MPRRKWLLVTPEMMNELAAYIQHRDEWVVVANELPEDVRFVRAVAARGGAYRYLCESRLFDDVSERDAPELPRPQLMSKINFIRMRQGSEAVQ